MPLNILPSIFNKGALEPLAVLSNTLPEIEDVCASESLEKMSKAAANNKPTCV